jgi:hypothetical protein
MKKPSDLDRLKNFGELPDDALVPTAVAALVLNTSVWSLYRGNLLRRVQTSQRGGGYRAGDVRKLIRGEKPAA